MNSDKTGGGSQGLTNVSLVCGSRKAREVADMFVGCLRPVINDNAGEQKAAESI